LVTQEVARRVAVKGGATFDFSLESSFFQPVLLEVLKF
jgi:hypothetical protein